MSRPPRGKEPHVVFEMVTRAGLQVPAVGVGCRVEEKCFIASGKQQRETTACVWIAEERQEETWEM